MNFFRNTWFAESCLSARIDCPYHNHEVLDQCALALNLKMCAVPLFQMAEQLEKICLKKCNRFLEKKCIQTLQIQ